MGLNYKPSVVVRGANASIINERLQSWELIDAAGRQSDQLTLRVLADGLSNLPTEGQIIGLALGFDGALVDKGEFKITRVRPRIFPNVLTIIATAAPFVVKDETEFKRRKSRSWSDTTVGKIFSDVVRSHGFSPRIAPELSGVAVKHIDQTDETDMSFLTRLAKQHDAVTKPVDQLYIFAKRGQLKTISGQTLKSVRLSLPQQNKPTSESFINAEADFPSRQAFKGVIAKYWDADKGIEVEVQQGAAPFKKIREQYESESHAREASEAELRKVTRTGVTVTLDVPGNPELVAEGLLELDGSFPGYMAGKWSIDRVVSTGTRDQGYRCRIEATEPV
uniref:Putative tail protein n=1 Tax=viral metagenome TaxID=1070528 RepID=A0A6M3KML7_9ZZZZ